MCLRPHLAGAVVAGVFALTPSAAPAALSDAFSPGPRLDLALELDYRGRYLTAEHVLRDEPPPDRFGQEQLADAKAEVARAYVRGLTDALLDEVVATFPLFETLERRYQQLTTFRLFQTDGNGVDDTAARGAAGLDGAASGRRLRPSRAADRGPGEEWKSGYAPSAGALGDPETPRGGSGGWPGGSAAGAAAGLFRAAARDGEVPVPVTVRFRLNAGIDRVAPSVEVTRGRLRCRVSFDAARERVEVTLARRFRELLDFELVYAEELGGGGTESRLAITLPF